MFTVPFFLALIQSSNVNDHALHECTSNLIDLFDHLRQSAPPTPPPPQPLHQKKKEKTVQTNRHGPFPLALFTPLSHTLSNWRIFILAWLTEEKGSHYNFATILLSIHPSIPSHSTHPPSLSPSCLACAGLPRSAASSPYAWCSSFAFPPTTSFPAFSNPTLRMQRGS